MLIRNTQSFKPSSDRASARLLVLLVAVMASMLAVAGCSGGDSETGSTSPTATSGDQGKVFESAPIEPGTKAPKGLNDASGEALIALLQSDPQYNAYVSLLQLSNVASELATRDSVTVFAPVNGALSGQADLLDDYLAPESLESALASLESGSVPEIDDPDRLASLLRRGIVDGEVPPARLRPGLDLAPLEGPNLRLTASDGAFQVEGVGFDSGSGTLAANGVLYPTSGLVGP